MYLSKFWFFLVTVLAVLAITIALIMPRPAERATVKQEETTVRNACLITNILLRDNARSRIQNTSSFAQTVRQTGLAQTLAKASEAETISPELNGTGRRELTKLLEKVPEPKPSFVWLLDSQGRVVARSDLDDTTFGDSVRGYYVVQDALDGYVRDDLWMMPNGLYRVTAAPVLTEKLAWAGAIVLGRSMDKAFASKLSKDGINANINFYVAGDSVASSNPVQIHKEVIKASEELAELEEGHDCNTSTLVNVTAGNDSFRVVSARLPGEAGEQGAFYSVFIKQATTLDFMGMLKASKKGDLSFDRFPWIRVGILFIILLAIGFFLMNREVDSPLKKLGANAVAMAKGASGRFDEAQHKGKYGSIARSVNIGIEKSERDAKAAKQDLDQLLGPAPSPSVSAAASALPPMAAAPPPPGDFKFNAVPNKKPAIPTPTPKPRGMPGMTPTPSKPDSLTPPPRVAKMKSATDMQVAPPPVALPSAITDDILAQSSKKFMDDDMPTMINDLPGENYFQHVYEEFIALKTTCGESTDNLTFERFAKKLQKNKDALMAKHDCESVTFQVYAKDGKAALKASPVK